LASDGAHLNHATSGHSPSRANGVAVENPERRLEGAGNQGAAIVLKSKIGA